MSAVPLDLTIRCGLEFVYEATAPTPAIMLFKARHDLAQQIEKEELSITPKVSTQETEDGHGNIVHRLILPPGRTTVRVDSFIAVPSVPENFGAIDEIVPVEQLSPDLLRYTLPSRYCDSDKLMDFAYQQFGQIPHGLRRVQAICDWVHQNIEYRWGAGSPYTAASEIIAQRFGVCRDFAHVALTLCRCFNLPARYVTGYVPDISFQDPGSPMDFHAYFEVFIGGHWLTYDARFNVPRIGRVKIACGLDAVDAAFSTLYGAARLAFFSVWTYQIDPEEVRLGDPIDLTKRLCGTPTLRFPPSRGPKVNAAEIDQN